MRPPHIDEPRGAETFERFLYAARAWVLLGSGPAAEWVEGLEDRL